MNLNSSTSLFAAVLTIVCACARADAADTGCADSPGDCVATGHWNFSIGVGAGVRTNPLVNGRNIPLVVIPQVSYYGKRFFLSNLDLGFTLSDTDSNSVSLVATPGYDRVFFYRGDLQNLFVSGFAQAGSVAQVPELSSPEAPGAAPLPRRTRRVTYLAGPEWTFKFRAFTGQLDLLHEITGRNHGNEIRAALAFTLYESAAGEVIASAGATWKSADIVNYYYGERGIYSAGAALSPFVKLAYVRPLNTHWRLSAFAHYERLGSSIADSPIIVENHVATVFAGATYSF